MSNTKAKVLYVEDDLYLSFVTQDNLELKGYDVVLCKDGIKAYEAFKAGKFDICILDIMLPNMDGFELAEKIRRENKDIPILFLSAKTLKEDKIKGFKLGADDYITKPFSIEELDLRIKVFLKRSNIKLKTEYNSHFEIGMYKFDFSNLLLENNEGKRKLTIKEAELLRFLTSNCNKVLKKEFILNEVWNDESYMASRSLDVFISRLRKYLSADQGIQIENIHGVGYKFNLTKE